MKIPYQIGEKTFLIEPYTTKIEKDILILLDFKVFDIDRYFEILNFETEYDLSEIEKKLILYKHREVSLGDEVNITFKCSKCKIQNETVLELSNFISPGERNDSDIRKLLQPVSDENLNDFLNEPIDVDDLDIEEYEKLLQRIKDNQLSVSFIRECKCINCSEIKYFDVGSINYILESMSDDTLMTLYKSYNHLVFFGKYSKTDIDSMYGFERTIFIGLLDKLREDLKNAR